MAEKGTEPSVVLVHGAWHDPWHWHEVAKGGFEPPAEEPNIHPQTDREMVDERIMIMKPDRAPEVLFHDCPDVDDAVAASYGWAAAACDDLPHGDSPR
ncbi:hypothetical protein [Flexivirga endophytica]|nr:hypothetical protein [Flexivirga endophytica]